MNGMTRTQMKQEIAKIHAAIVQTDPLRDTDYLIDLTHQLHELTTEYDEKMWNAEWRNS